MGYIYIRWHSSYKNLVKLGETEQPVERDQTYITGEPERGYYLLILKVKDEELCEQLLEDEFKEFHHNGSGGTEFYDVSILDKITDVFNSIGIHYEECDINDINRKIRMKKLLDTIKKRFLQKKMKRRIEELRNGRRGPDMRDYQITENIMNWFDLHMKGILNWCCGLGKTFTGINLSKKYVTNYLLIGLNSIPLFPQWIKELKKFYNLPIMCICCSTIESTLTTTSPETINGWFDNHPKGIVITTYRSSHKLKEFNKEFDFAIFDECHHLCNVKGYNSEGDDPEEECLSDIKCRNTDILSLNIKKQLGLTATMKKLDTENKKQMVDNFDENKFGKVIDEKSILWGINKGYICDYSLSMLKVDYDIIEEMINKNEGDGIHKDDYYLFLSAYISLISILNYGSKKILIFTNRICDIEKVFNFITTLISTLEITITRDDIFKIDKNTENTREMITNFEGRDIAIMINVFKIGEGIDIPSLDSVLFADNMLSSIRIIQSALRCCRKDPKNLEKHAKIIIPMIYEEDESYCEEDNGIKIKTFPLIKRIVEEISYSDKNIISKVKVDELNGETELKPKEPQRINEDIPEIDNDIKMRIIKRCNIGKLKITMIKKNIQILGGRKDDSNTYVEDYKKNKQLKMGLPDYDWIKEYMDRNNYKWFDLYSVDVHQYMTWEEFEKKYYKTQESKYNDMPSIHDLEDIYPKYNKRFWDDSGVDADEF